MSLDREKFNVIRVQLFLIAARCHYKRILNLKIRSNFWFLPLKARRCEIRLYNVSILSCANYDRVPRIAMWSKRPRRFSVQVYRVTVCADHVEPWLGSFSRAIFDQIGYDFY